MKTANTREIVLKILLDIEKNNEYSNIALNRALRSNQFMDKRDRAFISRLVEGTVEYRIRLDYIINQFSKTEVRKCKPLVRCILRMSVYQIFFMDSVPDEAACNEALRLAEAHGFKNLKGFINGVLRTICRNKNQIVYPDKRQKPEEYLSIMYSVPEELIHILQKSYDMDTLELVFKEMFKTKGTTLRVNEDKISVDDYKKLLEDAGIEASSGIYGESSLIISGYDYINRLPGYREGWFTVQDESASLAVASAGIRCGDNIIDVCAAPGGKTMYAAYLAGKTGHVLARDISSDKTELIKENLERMDIDNVTVEVFDGRQNDESLNGSADIVIADVPCSGLGVMGRKNDIKYNATEARLSELIRLQRQILKACVDYVKPGGRLLYSTCTINVGENEDNVKWLLDNFDLTPVPLGEGIPKSLRERGKAGHITMLQGIDGSDGFFISLFEKGRSYDRNIEVYKK